MVSLRPADAHAPAMHLYVELVADSLHGAYKRVQSEQLAAVEARRQMTLACRL